MRIQEEPKLLSVDVPQSPLDTLLLPEERGVNVVRIGTDLPTGTRICFRCFDGSSVFEVWTLLADM